jgi:uncharacterized protein (DUF488 family)
VFTVGHSTLPLSRFMALLSQNQIEVLADVRSYPYSRRSPQFQGAALKARLKEGGIRYVFLGKELGGRPDDPEYYEPDGRVSYARLARRASFEEGIARLETGVARYRVAIMCSEEDPSECHRHLLIGRVLLSDGLGITHIRATGTLERLSGQPALADRRGQLALHHLTGDSDWKSIRPVLQRSPQRNSSSPLERPR